MKAQIVALVLYLIGSCCFLVGTLLMLRRAMRG